MKINKNGYWTFNKCKEEALKYETRGDFCKLSATAYVKCLSKKWINDVCSHMKTIKHVKNYWTYEKCKEEALKYETRTKFYKNCNGAYCKAWDMNWLENICSHMEITGNLYKRCIYVYEFSDNFAYIGLTYNTDNRNKQHMKRGPVFEHITINPIFIFKKLTNYIDCEEAKLKEDEYIKIYKNNNWNILNTNVAGSLGGKKIKWTIEKCKEEALKFDKIGDYKKNSLSYRSAIRNKWLDEICKHMNRIKKPFNYWSKENCIEEFLKYGTIKDFREKSGGSYSSVIKNKWLDDIKLLNLKI